MPRRSPVRCLATLVFALLFGARVSPAADALPLVDGDRVVLIGNTLIEREQQYGDWELMLATSFPRANVTFRNLGFSGDTVWGESRGYFDPPEKGYQNLIELVRELKPTVIILGYGNNEAWAGEQGLERFRDGLDRLLDDLEQSTGRIILLSPLLHDRPRPHIPDPAQYNGWVRAYAEAIRHSASERGCAYVDLIGPHANDVLTYNGQHLAAEGYRRTAAAIARQLDLRPVELSAAQQSALRQALRLKNELFFHRWRPQNQTYLFGFRKHEQGQNAQEIAQFDPLIAAEEARIRDVLGTLAPAELGEKGGDR